MASPAMALGWAVGAVILAGIVLVLMTTLDRGRSRALVRLDWFTPVIRKQGVDKAVSHSWIGRLLRKWIPSSLQSDRTTKRRGPLRRGLRKLGISWLASPVRRIVQSIALCMFFGFFFFVCWPYSARPVAKGYVSLSWAFETIDSATGEFLFRKSTAVPIARSGRSDLNPEQEVSVSDLVFLFEEQSPSQNVPDSSALIGRFKVIAIGQSHARLQLDGEVTGDLLDRFLIATGTYAIYQRDPSAWPSHYADNLARKEVLPTESFLLIDPLVSLSTAIASRSWVWSLVSAAIILIVCTLIPRGFCGYLCPLGTTIDLFDWAIAGRVKSFRVPDDGWWVHIKYYLLAGTLVSALGGVLVSGFFSAIPVITRAMLFLVDPLQNGFVRGWHLVPEVSFGHVLSILMFCGVLGLGFLRPRFWCKYVCPSGAVFSIGNLFRVTERKVESSCIHCNKCVEICPFDAIKPDFTTRTTDCTLCQSCGGVCPTHAIKFVERWNVVELKVMNVPPTNETALGRRGFLSLAAGSAAATVGGLGVAGLTKTWGADLDNPDAFRPVRPPGSVPEQEFLQMCIRCGECFKACPNNVLQPEFFEQGFEGLWSPMVNANWAGCESSCNACGQVCPTGAIRALPLIEKKVARMGLAIVSEVQCLPYAGREACDLCVQECNAAGYQAIEYKQVAAEVDSEGQPVDGTGFLAPVVLRDACVGCGLCQTRCFAINVKEKQLLQESAIIVHAGDGKEDRLMAGSYIALREQERFSKQQTARSTSSDNYFVPPTESGQTPKQRPSHIEQTPLSSEKELSPF